MYKVNVPEPKEEVLEIAIELTSKCHIICDNTEFLYPLHRKLALLIIPRSKYSIENMWVALKQKGYYPNQWNIQIFYQIQSWNAIDFWEAHDLEILTSHEYEHLILCQNKITNKYEVWDEENFSNVSVGKTIDDAVINSGTHWNDWLEI